jgi:hypothetical protein
MANRAYLVGSSNGDTAGPGENGVNYNPDTEILAGASTQIPVFWLSLFDESNIKPHVVKEYSIPAPVCEAATARTLLQQRRAKILAAFSQSKTHWDAWERLITEAPFKFFKLDATEVWDLDPELFQSHLPPAVRWFSSGSADDFAKLLSVAEIPMIQPRGFLGRLVGNTASGYDMATKTLTMAKDGAGRSDSVGHHLHGYAWVREVPWKDA